MEYGLNVLLEAGYKEPRIGIDTYIIKSNYNDIPNLLRFCRQNKILPYFESFLLPNFSKRKELEHEIISDKEITKLFDKLKEIDEKEFGIKTKLHEGQRIYCSSFNQEFESPICDINGIKTCSRPFSVFSVVNNGDVRFCVVHYKTIGNIKEKSLEEILSVNNPKLREVFHKPCIYSTANYLGGKNDK